MKNESILERIFWPQQERKDKTINERDLQFDHNITFSLTTMKLLSFFLVVWCPAVANCLNLINTRPQKVIQQKAAAIAKHAAAICVAGTLFLGQPYPAVAVSDEIFGALETAIVDASDATYPVLKALTSDTLSPLANKVASIVTKKIPARKLTIAFESAVDALLSIPDDKLAKFTTTVKESYQGISSNDCSVIPFPLDAANMVQSSEAVSKLDSAKVKQVTEKLSALTQAVPYSSSGATGGICLPTMQGLEQIWIGQTQLLVSIPTPIKQQLASQTGPALKSVPNADLLRVLPDVKKIIGSVDRKQANKFQETGKTLDKVLKQDYRFKSLQPK
jgi:hypothetical protein